MNNAAINVQVFEWTYVFISLGVELLGQMVTLYLTYWGPTQNAFHNGSPTLHSYQQCVRVPISPRLCQHLLFSFFGFNYSHPSRCKMVSEYSFDLHFPNDPDAGRVWGQEEKGTTEDEMAGWHHWLDAHEFGWTLGVGDGQGDLACCDSWGRKESDMTEWLNWTEWLMMLNISSCVYWPLVYFTSIRNYSTPLPI